MREVDSHVKTEFKSLVADVVALHPETETLEDADMQHNSVTEPSVTSNSSTNASIEEGKALHAGRQDS